MFAPGHLGELTQIVSFDMVDAVLAEVDGLKRRVRKLPARVVVYLLLAAALFSEVGYLGVWRKLTGALDGLPIPTLTASALWQARTRLGPAPLRVLFELLAGPAATTLTRAVRWRGLLVCAIDGTSLDVPDSPSHRARLGKRGNQYTTAGYPQIRLVVLVACGTRAIIDAVFGPAEGPGTGESTYATRLLRPLHAGMIVLLDRGLSGNPLLVATHGTGAHLLARLSASRRPPLLGRLSDGSILSNPGGVPVRIIQCQITISITAGTQTGHYRLATTLLDHRTHPAAELVILYHQRWEVESAYFAIKKTMLGRRVLRSTTHPASTRKSTHS
ncbi:IS4 family transposase [Spirillospora sp. NPDC048911]|uniref:IS4 family transposase n=1 Tax=Spirillospora sp. NPDC048911 TaxID=3364527 RepID=UPI00372094AF